MTPSVSDNRQTASTGDRVILLGASNAVRGLPTIIETASRCRRLPMDVMAAVGHGRSYGIETSVLGRRLPSILGSELWNQLALRPPRPTVALVTDIGNDLIYGQSVDTILRWVEGCLSQLSGTVDRLVVTRLPLETVSTTGPWKFRFISQLLFPGSHLDREKVLDQAAELDERLTPFASRYGAYIVRPDPAWYGWDPIHIRMTQLAVAWRYLLKPWTDGYPPEPVRVPLRRTTAIYRAKPHQWWFWGISRHREQPAITFPDGTTASLY